MAPLLGWIHPDDRTQEQADAHEAAVKAMPKFSIPGGVKTLAKGEKIVLYNFLDKPECINDIGFQFSWVHQNTGSCVGASLGNALAALSGVQRFNPDKPTKAFLTFWPYAYGMTRTDEGDRSQGDGAVNSIAVERAKKGVLPLSEAKGVPQYKIDEDGIQLSGQTEYEYSIANSILRGLEPTANKFPIGTAAVANNANDLYEGIINGYPGYGGCSMYADGGTLKGTGENACVVTKFSGRGGHSTGFYGAWNHPDFGPMLLYGQNWLKDTFPHDPSVGVYHCTAWMVLDEVQKIFDRYDGNGEYFNLSHATYFPAQDWVLNYLM